MNKLNIPNTITLKKNQIAANRISDGGELIPAEIQADANKYSNESLENGYTIDDEGIINNYATEPDTSLANYPSPEQQKRYIFLGTGAALLVAIALLIAFTVS